MTYELYRDLYNLITEDLNKEQSRVDDYIRGLTELDESESESEYVYLGTRIAKHKTRVYELEYLLAKFESEVEEPKH